MTLDEVIAALEKYGPEIGADASTGDVHAYEVMRAYAHHRARREDPTTATDLVAAYVKYTTQPHKVN